MNDTHKGQLYAVLAFLFWGGIAPIYFKEVASVSALEVLSHRVIWSVIFLIPLILYKKQLAELFKTIKDIKKVKYLVFSTLFVSINWLVFIWAVANEMILEASLGYYINPLINALLGYLIFSERMTKRQYIAIAIACGAVLYELIMLGSLPWVSLILATTFGLYGMLRKQVNVGSLVGLLIEVIILLPFAFVYLIVLVNSSNMSFLSGDSYVSFMLTLGGLVTIIPLLLFNGAATRMRLTTLGFFQYIGPTVAFIVAVFVYSEPFSFDKLVTFSLIWLALFIFSFDALFAKKVS